MRFEIISLRRYCHVIEVEPYLKLGFNFIQSESNKENFWLEGYEKVFIEVDNVLDLIKIASDLDEELIIDKDGTIIIHNADYY